MALQVSQALSFKLQQTISLALDLNDLTVISFDWKAQPEKAHFQSNISRNSLKTKIMIKNLVFPIFLQFAVLSFQNETTFIVVFMAYTILYFLLLTLFYH